MTIARALLKDVPIVLLDEPTAALDPLTVSAVEEAIAALKADRTTTAAPPLPAPVSSDPEPV